jgi:hypothetical protein
VCACVCCVCAMVVRVCVVCLRVCVLCVCFGYAVGFRCLRFQLHVDVTDIGVKDVERAGSPFLVPSL